MRRISYYQWEQIREEIILLSIQWYIFYSLSYNELQEIMAQRGFAIDNTTINQLTQDYSVMAQKRWQKTQKRRNKGWRLVEIPFKINHRRKYLYRAIDAQGNTLDFMISVQQNKKNARLFFQKTISQDLENRDKNKLKQPSKTNPKNNFSSALISILLLILVGYIILDNVTIDVKQIPENIENNSNN
ncbi:IS6 family transposase [Cyanobacterium stanieri LEGE 03274]|uniref:IS6 family transposase n=1 Tax=Cyanobacterium stanieri LEGE 03274 TaxID=1828756 RepID=A0ABR9V765_9CHRO|nr:DDE-type integrase/transposase/recombinase [Cyanobacterium stanieri]MBE9223748.1 IS6 family transposase [Cyanobacterium stanieri LEGE 03274]